MSSSNDNLQTLIDLAREPSSDKRRELLRQMTDLFMEAPAAHSDLARSQFGEILGTIAHEMEMEVRQTLAARLAHVPEAPHALILQLASDEIHVARDILQNSKVLRDQDLVALASLQTQEHLHAIASRETVSATVSDVLVQRGDERVLTAVISNDGAEISRSAMETLTERIETMPALSAPLVSRSDVPADLLNELFFKVTSELRRVIISKMDNIDPVLIDGAIRQTERRIKARATPTDPDEARAMAFLDELARNSTINEGTLVTVARQHRFPETAAVLARLADIDFKTAKRVLSDAARPESLVIVCRACRFTRETFSTLTFKLKDGSRLAHGDQQPVHSVFEIMTLYDKVPVDAAQRVIRFWRMRKSADTAAA